MPAFKKRVKQYGNMRQRIRDRLSRILADPYDRTEFLHDNLKGLRSVRIDRNFRIIFAVSEEVNTLSETKKNFPHFCGYPQETVVFITVGPHEKSYELK